MISLSYILPQLKFKYINESSSSNFYVEEKPLVIETNDDNFNSEKVTVCKSLRERILTHFRNEILILDVNDIALIYTENTITYVVNHNGGKSISNESLDSLFSELSDKCFFRVNRQTIVSILSIKKLIKIGSGKLRIMTYPEIEKNICIGKNKAVAFKKWLVS